MIQTFFGAHASRFRRSRSGVLPAVGLLLLAGCAEPDTASLESPQSAAMTAPVEGPAGPSPEQDAFWASLQSHCGSAYAGRLSDATPHYAGLAGPVPVIHFRDCTDDRIHVAFHLDDDASRNWIVTRVEGTLRLKHDHRHEDGTEDEITQYGGDAPLPGLATRQIFWADAHTADILPERHDNFWFLDFVDAGTLEYGVHWPTRGHSVRFSFDLSNEVEAPPTPWGYEGGAP